MTQGPGITSFKITKTLVVDKYYTFIHITNLELLDSELQNLHNIINVSYKLNQTSSVKSLHKYYLYSRNKLDHIITNHHRIRVKRGLINGLGKAISWLTGNMDSDDKEKYDKIINGIERNAFHLEHNVENQLALNKKLIEEFNHDILIIQSNNKKMKQFLSSPVVNQIEINQQLNSIFLNLVLIANKIRDVETSIKYCKINILHSSILTHNDLESLQTNRNVTFLTSDLTALWQLSKVHCSIKDNNIYYFINVPLHSYSPETYFLLSYPIERDNLVSTIYAHPPLILRVNDELFTATCEEIKDYLYCHNKTLVSDKCILQIVNNVNLIDCKAVYTSSLPFIKYIPFVDYYLTFKVNKIVVNKHNCNDTVFLANTSLIKLDENETILDNKVIPMYKNSKVMSLSAQVFAHSDLNISFEDLHKFNIAMKPLEYLEDVPSTSIEKYYYFVSGALLLVLFLLMYLRCLRKRTLHRPGAETQTTQEDQTSVYPGLSCLISQELRT